MMIFNTPEELETLCPDAERFRHYERVEKDMSRLDRRKYPPGYDKNVARPGSPGYLEPVAEERWNEKGGKRWGCASQSEAADRASGRRPRGVR